MYIWTLNSTIGLYALGLIGIIDLTHLESMLYTLLLLLTMISIWMMILSWIEYFEEESYT